MISWKKYLADAITDPLVLADILQLDPQWAKKAITATEKFPLMVPKPYLDRIQPGDPKDPLLLQVLPKQEENDSHPLYTKDPLQESLCSPTKSLLHKYKSRALLTLAGSCSINCRYCFRRHFPYQEHQIKTQLWPTTLQYIKDSPDINEVILSGGEPLLVNDEKLLELWTLISDIPTIKRIRIHTRMPIAIPQRITDSFIKVLQSSHIRPIVTIHCNHPQEIDSSVSHALNQLHSAHIPVLNQSVLLRNINDSYHILAMLSEKLFDNHVQPYYLHLPDPVEGTSHFDISLDQAKAIYQQLQHELPGFLVPKLVRETAKRLCKTIIS